MRREKEFKNYLGRMKLPTKYVGYCKNHIEKAFGGIDMDEIISKHQNISIVRDKLTVIEKKKKCIDDYMVGLNHYLEFAVAQGGLVKSASNPEKIDSFAGPIVQYYFDVPRTERNELLRKALEDEYPKILQFAKKVFGVDKGYIPVYLSKEIPPLRIHKFSKKFIDELRNNGQENREMSDRERNLINEVIERKGYITSVVAQFCSGEKPYIEIYYKNLPTHNSLEFAINYLAHEYMHFLEYENCFHSGCTAFADDKVSEALADFFGVLYSIKCGGKFDIEVACDRYVEWKVLNGSGWPYAYALYFYTVKGISMGFSSNFVDYINHGSIDKLIEVFNSALDVVDAYKKLINL